MADSRPEIARTLVLGPAAEVMVHVPAFQLPVMGLLLERMPAVGVAAGVPEADGAARQEE